MTALAHASPPWPPAVFASPALRGLDPAGQDAVLAAGRVVDRDGVVYQEGDVSESLFVVVAGAVELTAVRRGDAATSVLGTARAGDSFGEEAMLPGLTRRATARAVDGARLAEVPIAVLLRALGRAGGQAASARELRYVERAAARALLACSVLGRELPADDTELLLDGVTLQRFGRGERLFDAGDRADRAFLVVEGLIQLQREGERAAVVAYLARGDAVGDDDALADRAHATTAVAAGDSWCAIVPRALLRTLADRNPGLPARLRRVAEADQAGQAALVGGAAARSTQHVFKDLYRLQVARSLLVIEQDGCVRCGHCAWSCAEVHGVSRLERRGDKLITPVGDGDQRAASLLLPSTCQHCRNAACMIDCPTGAIGRDPTGEVFIRPELCTGCGNCVRGCPWDNIKLAPRPAAPPRRSLPVVGDHERARPQPVIDDRERARALLGLSAEVAVKCDLCREHEAPACVEACPTGALIRIDPSRDVAEVARLFGRAPGAVASDVLAALPAAGAARALVATIAVVAALVLAAAAGRLGWHAERGPGLAAGVIAGLAIVGLAAYVVPKRLVRRRLRPRGARAAVTDGDRPPARSRTRGPLRLHLALGLAVPAAVLAHAGGRVPPTVAGALTLAFALATVAGGLGALAYRVLPRGLTRLERRGALPEDLAGEAVELRARLFREASGADELVKRIVLRILAPYARAPLGWLALLASGRDLGTEERRLRARIDRVLAGRGHDRLDGLAALCRIAVELRALPGRRALTAALRGWLPLHVVAAAMTLALLVAHVATAVLR